MASLAGFATPAAAPPSELQPPCSSFLPRMQAMSRQCQCQICTGTWIEAVQTLRALDSSLCPGLYDFSA